MGLLPEALNLWVWGLLGRKGAFAKPSDSWSQSADEWETRSWLDSSQGILAAYRVTERGQRAHVRHPVMNFRFTDQRNEAQGCQQSAHWQ